MSDILVTSPYRPFTLPNQFKAVLNGYIYCGTVDAVDPSVSQVQVYLANEDGSRTQVSQPLRTNAGGFLVYNGQPAKFVTDSNHSLMVRDSLGNQLWYAPDVSIVDPDTAYQTIGAQAFEALRRSYANAGYNVVGTFDAGFTYVNQNDVGIDLATGKGFTGPTGPVAAGTNPLGGGFTDRSDELLVGHLPFVLSRSYPLQGDDVSDDTAELTRLLTDAVVRGGAESITGKVYRITSPIIITVPNNTHVEINMRGSLLRYTTPLQANEMVKVLTFLASDPSFDTSVKTKNIKIHCDVPYFESTDGADRRGIGGIAFVNIAKPSVDGYYPKKMFYSAGISASKFKHNDFRNIVMEDVGSKFRPTVDDTGTYDAAGDAIYLLDAIGNATTTMSNVVAKSYDGKLGRAGLVCEELTPWITASHVVTIDNGSFDGYQRITHQEDGGKSKITWTGGKAKRFSNCNFNLGGVGDDVYVVMDHVDIDVDPPFNYGGTAGLQNYQSAGRGVYKYCTVKYHDGSMQDRGSYTVRGGSFDLGSTTLTHVTSKDVTYDGVPFASSGGVIRGVSGTTILTVNNTKLADNMTLVVDGSGAVGSAEILDTDVGECSLQFVNVRQKPVKLVNAKVKPKPGVAFLAGSFNCVVEFFDSELTYGGTADFVGVYGDGGVDTSYHNTKLTNVIPAYANGGGEPDASDISRVVGCTLLAVGSQTGQSFMNTFNAGCVIQATTFIDKTAAQGMTIPATNTFFAVSGLGNTLVKNTGITAI